MATVSLQFQGADAPTLLWILATISLVVAAWGGWQVSRGRWQYGLSCLLVGLVPLVAGLLMRFSFDYSGGAGWMLLLGLEIAGAVAVFYMAVYAYLGTQRLTTLMVLRVLAILSLLLILFKPAISFSAADDNSKPRLLILVDRSSSMSVTDPPNPPRYRQATQVLKSQLPQLRRNFQPVWHHFGSALETADSLEALEKREPPGDGSENTNIPDALQRAATEFDHKDVAGILLLSDGQDNSGKLSGDAAKEAGIPVYVVGIGSATEAGAGGANLQLVSAETEDMKAIINNVTRVFVQVKASRLGSASAEVQLFEEGSDQPVVREAIQTSKSIDIVKVPLKWTPRSLGAPSPAASKPSAVIRKLHVAIARNPALSIGEPNRIEMHVMLTEPKIRVLYVESMRPEYKYLKRLLDTDTNVRYTGLVRISENRFWAYGNSEGKPLTGLPTTDEDFARFDVIILGDIDRTFLIQQMPQVRRFVDNGGGLLMLGGHNSFGPGGYGGTDVETVLPVLMGTRSQPQETVPFIPQLTADGEGHPIFEGIADFFPGPGGRPPKARQDQLKLPDLLGCVTVVRAKPGASVLAIHPSRSNENGPLTVLAVQSFGKGRSAAFAADTTWQWYMSMQALGLESPYQRFWAQLIRWLAKVEVKSRGAFPAALLKLDRPYVQVGEGAKVKFTAFVQDTKGMASESAQVTCSVIPADGRSQVETLPLAPTQGRGLFEAEHRPQRPGQYAVKLTALDSAGQVLGTDELPLRVAPQSLEMERLARNEGLLQMVARDSDGRYEDISALPDLIDYIVERQKGLAAVQPQGKTYKLYKLFIDLDNPKYDFTGPFVLFVCLLTGEWMLRRNWQLH